MVASPVRPDELDDVANVLFPIATFTETAGTFVNAEGRWQSFDAAADPVGESRPGWRVLRVLGNELQLSRCEYRTPSDVTADLERELDDARELSQADAQYKGSFAPHTQGGASTAGTLVLDVPIYEIDALVRRSQPLQETVLGRQGAA